MKNKLLEEAMNIEDFNYVVEELMKKYGVEIENNAIMVGVFCRDDQSSTIRKWIEDHYTKHGLDYDLSTFGGVFHYGRTHEDVAPAAHHIPPAKEKYLVVFNFTHIGYDEHTGKWGKFIRYGHEDCTSSCGAINTLYAVIKEGKEVNSLELKALEEMMKEVVEKEQIIEKENEYNDHIYLLTEKLYEVQKEHFLKELEVLAEKEGVNVLYLGGIEIDTDKDAGKEYNDKILLKDIYFISKEGSIKREELIRKKH